MFYLAKYFIMLKVYIKTLITTSLTKQNSLHGKSFEYVQWFLNFIPKYSKFILPEVTKVWLNKEFKT